MKFTKYSYFISLTLYLCYFYKNKLSFIIFMPKMSNVSFRDTTIRWIWLFIGFIFQIRTFKLSKLYLKNNIQSRLLLKSQKCFIFCCIIGKFDFVPVTHRKKTINFDWMAWILKFYLIFQFWKLISFRVFID